MQTLYLFRFTDQHHTTSTRGLSIYPIFIETPDSFSKESSPLFLILFLGLLDVLVADILPLALEKIQVSCVRNETDFEGFKTYTSVHGVPDLVGGSIKGTVI